jgi:hypothetical protein
MTMTTTTPPTDAARLERLRELRDRETFLYGTRAAAKDRVVKVAKMRAALLTLAVGWPNCYSASEPEIATEIDAMFGKLIDDKERELADAEDNLRIAEELVATGIEKMTRALEAYFAK